MKLYCKDADNVIYQRLTKEHRESAEWNKILESLQFFAADGLH